MASTGAATTPIPSCVTVASWFGRRSAVQGHDLFLLSVIFPCSSSRPLQRFLNSFTVTYSFLLRTQTIAVPSSLTTFVSVSDAWINKFVPRTPIAAVGVQIVYDRLLASPVINLSVPFDMLSAIVPDDFGPEYTKSSNLTVESGPTVKFVLSLSTNFALLSAPLRTASFRKTLSPCTTGIWLPVGRLPSTVLTTVCAPPIFS